jgi:hypothetical protein
VNRHSFLKLSALLPLMDVGTPFRSAEHQFQYESVIGTSDGSGRPHAVSSRGRGPDYHADTDQIRLTFAAPGARTLVTMNRGWRLGVLTVLAIYMIWVPK